MVRFPALGCYSTCGIPNKEGVGQVRTLPLIEIRFVKYLLPHARPGLAVVVATGGSQSADRQIKLIQHMPDLLLECGEPLLVLFECFGVGAEVDAALVAEDCYFIPEAWSGCLLRTPSPTYPSACRDFSLVGTLGSHHFQSVALFPKTLPEDVWTSVESCPYQW